MNKLFRNILSVAIIATTMAVSLSACGGNHGTNSVTYNYDVDNGETIAITLVQKNGMVLTETVPFETHDEDGHMMSAGMFIYASDFDGYTRALNRDPSVTNIKNGTRNDCRYVYYERTDPNTNENEFNYVLCIENSEVGVVLGNMTSQKQAQTVFDNMSFTSLKSETENNHADADTDTDIIETPGVIENNKIENNPADNATMIIPEAHDVPTQPTVNETED